MNRFHANHQDPDIRKKYADWRNAMDRYEAVSAGFNTHSEMKLAQQKKKDQKKSVEMLLNVIGGQRVKGGKFAGNATTKQTHKRMRAMQRTGGKRGS